MSVSVRHHSPYAMAKPSANPTNHTAPPRSDRPKRLRGPFFVDFELVCRESFSAGVGIVFFFFWLSFALFLSGTKGEANALYYGSWVYFFLAFGGAFFFFGRGCVGQLHCVGGWLPRDGEACATCATRELSRKHEVRAGVEGTLFFLPSIVIWAIYPSTSLDQVLNCRVWPLPGLLEADK